MNTHTNVLKVQELKKVYRNIAVVDKISFELQKGELITLLGPNGAGKSTSMKMISGFLRPDEGTALIMGKDIQEERLSAQAMMGYLPEGSPSYPHFPVFDFLNFMALLRIQDSATRKKRILNVVEKLSLESVLQKPISTLSKGFQRRVCLAQALLNHPPFLMLDEPTDGLDPNQKEQVHQILLELRSKGVGLLISTHRLDEVGILSDRVLFLHQGKLVANDDIVSFKKRHPTTHTLHIYFEHEAPKEALLKEELGQNIDLKKDIANPNHLSITFYDAKTESQKIKELALKHGWRMIRMQTEDSQLEEVFKKLTEGNMS